VTVSILNSSGVKVALAQHLASKKSVVGKGFSTFKWSPSHPQSVTQTAKVLKLLLDGKVLTKEGVAKEYEIYCLPQIVWHLKEYHGWPIKMHPKKAEDFNM
jgi:hypothetical protein